jgi:hypothetical protein
MDLLNTGVLPWCCNPEDFNLKHHCHESLKTCKSDSLFVYNCQAVNSDNNDNTDFQGSFFLVFHNISIFSKNTKKKHIFFKNFSRGMLICIIWY